MNRDLIKKNLKSPGADSILLARMPPPEVVYYL